jgi:hypothetical protein
VLVGSATRAGKKQTESLKQGRVQQKKRNEKKSCAYSSYCCYCCCYCMQAPSCSSGHISWACNLQYGTYILGPTTNEAGSSRSGLDKAPGGSSFFPGLLQCGTELWGFVALFELVGCLLARSVTLTSANHLPSPTNRVLERDLGLGRKVWMLDARCSCEM